MNHRKRILSILLVLSVFVSTAFFPCRKTGVEPLVDHEAQAATHEGGHIQYREASNNSYRYGTVENPFTALEIVAYAGYAEFGYLVGGHEPVDMEKLCRISRGEQYDSWISKNAARQFLDHLVERGYLEALTAEEAANVSKKDEELPDSLRKFKTYHYATDTTKGYITNKNSFLRESIGLKYITKGNVIYFGEYDVDAYEFLGWYKKGTNEAFDFSEKLFTDVEVYAKWRTVLSDNARTTTNPTIAEPSVSTKTPAPGFPSGITIHFASNVPASFSGGTIENLPSDLLNVQTDGTKNGSAITEPTAPTLSGSGASNYILKGYSLNPDGTSPYRFGDPIPLSYLSGSTMTLYPIWTVKQNCTITFDAALPDSVVNGNVPIWPAILSGAAAGAADTVRFLQVEAGTRLTDTLVPSVSMLGNVDYKVKNYQIDVVTVTPSEINKGGNVGGGLYNPDAKLDNLALIQKANLILISPQSHFFTRKSLPPDQEKFTITDLLRNNEIKEYASFDGRSAVYIWEHCTNNRLFDATTNKHEGNVNIFGFLQKDSANNDLCWEVVMAIFNECVNETPKAALIYDAEAYQMARMLNSGATAENPKKIFNGVETSINVIEMFQIYRDFYHIDDWSEYNNIADLAHYNNVYKLYIMLNQMNPKQFYETFLETGRVYPIMHEGISTGIYKFRENTEEISNEEFKWNTATFLLCSLLDEAQRGVTYTWDPGSKKLRLTGNPWAEYGIMSDLFSYFDNRDDATGEVISENGIISGNTFSYRSDEVNIIEYFATNESLPRQTHVTDVYDYFSRNDDGDQVTMSEVVYYLLQQAIGSGDRATDGGSLGGEDIGEPYESDIRILELQPSEHYLNPVAWQLKIATILPEFTGELEITHQNSDEFIGKIEDLNSKYDLLYIGSDVSNYPSERSVSNINLLDYAEPSARLHRAGETVTLAEDTRITSREVREVSHGAGTWVTIQTPQTIYRSGDNVPISPGHYTAPVDLKVSIPFNEFIHVSDRYRYEPWVRDVVDRHGEAWSIVYAGDTVNVSRNVSGSYPVATTVSAGETIRLEYTQTIKEYAGPETSEVYKAGTTITLTQDQTLRALRDGVTIEPSVMRYFHTGAEINMDAKGNHELEGALGGNLDTVNHYFYSGNDITKKKMDEVLHFVESGYPVMIDKELMHYVDDLLVVNTATVDSASNLYLLLTALAAGENDETSPYYGKVYYDGVTKGSSRFRRNKNNLLAALRKTKCELKVTRMPALYAHDKSVAASYLNGAAGKENEKKLEIAFTVADSVNANYSLRLYIDQNSDGRFDESERLDGRLDIYEEILGRREPVTQIRTARPYVAVADLSLYVGIIPWRLEVVRSDNPVIRDSVEEFSAILPSASEKPILKVLQIIPDGSNTTVYLPSKEEVETLEWLLPFFEDIENVASLARSFNAGQTKWTQAQINRFKAYWNAKGGDYVKIWNDSSVAASLGNDYRAWAATGFDPEHLLEKIRTLSSWHLCAYFLAPVEDIADADLDGARLRAVGFWLYMRAVRDFSIEATRMTISEFVSETASQKASNATGFKDWADAKYDMLVLGFSDCYQDMTNDDALEVIEEFISTGKQILFTHDTTSFRNYSESARVRDSGGYYWGYNMNRTFREILGMDRFGTTLQYPLDIYGNLLSGGISIREAIEQKKDAPYKNGTSQDISTNALLEANVLNTMAGGTRKYYTQGFSDLLLYRIANERYSSPLFTQTASKVNIGQITEYPYRVGSLGDGMISIANTHEQYYQLDMEGGDIVVWYTLEGEDAGYQKTNHDVRNNYYLYSRGNIIYSGVGHSKDLSYDEMKLFVNTFVASYRAPAQPPTIEVKNSDASTPTVDYFYIDFDSWEEDTPVGDGIYVDGNGNSYQRVEFVINESTPLKNQLISMGIYVEDQDGVPLSERTTTTGEEKNTEYVVEAGPDGKPQQITHPATGGNLIIRRASDGVTVTELLPGEEYIVDIPLSVMGDGDSANLLLRSDIQHGRRNDQMLYDYQKVVFVRRGLYDLD